MQSSEVLYDPSQILGQMREALAVHDFGHRITFWNRGAERLFGIPAASALGRTWVDLLGEHAALTQENLASLLAEGTWSGEFAWAAPSGHALTIERHCTLLHDRLGQPCAVLTTHTDVTEQRRAEKEIVLLSNVMEQRIRNRTAQLEQSNRELREFAYSIAHDLRAPLSSIDGFSAQLELRLAERLDEKSRHYLSRVRAGVQVMANLTDALLALADLSNAELLHEPVDLSQLARSVIESLREAHPHREVEVTVADTDPVRGDARLLTDVLQNLLGNAWKFTSNTRDARIEFGSEGVRGALAFYVKDNGAGFDPDYAHKLFGPFQRLHRADEFEGTGIGLAMVRKIIARHGGRVWAEGRPGAGATFWFTLR